MAKIIQTADLTPTTLKNHSEKLWVYNGLDCCITMEVLDAILPELDNNTGATYALSRALQAPAIEMQLRGVLVDNRQRQAVISQYLDTLDRLETSLERIVREGLDIHGFNWRSPQQLKDLFYGKLGIPEVRKRGGIATVNRDALERMEQYLIARPIISHLIALRDIGKKIGFLRTAIDPDGRIRTSYNISGTDTGRFSSSLSDFGTGGNLQNVEEALRSIFISDPGKKMAYLDAAQGESRIVGAIEWNLFNDGAYLDACESSDLHTTVAKLCWTDVPWTGDPIRDRKLAEAPYYRHYDRRFMCKKIGHGTNYYGKPYTLAKQAKIPQRAIEEFQPKYFEAFPAHQMWHAYVRDTLRNEGILTSLSGRKRIFFGRRDADETLRAAIAFDPQGSLADMLNIGMLHVWRSHSCELLMQIHDAILIQYPEEKEDEIVPKVQQLLSVKMELRNGREFSLPYDAKVGWNWGKAWEGNPDGLKDYRGADARKRTKKPSLLDRRIRDVY